MRDEIGNVSDPFVSCLPFSIPEFCAPTRERLPQRVLDTVMGDTSLNQDNNSVYRNPTFYYNPYFGTLWVRIQQLAQAEEDY